MSDTDKEALTHITRGVVEVLDSWKLQISEMQLMLGLPEKVRSRAFQKFREGREQLPDDESILRRADYLVRISDALRTTYPCNPAQGARWLRQKHRRFGGRAPLAVILESDNVDASLVRVLSELDCTFAWDLTGSKHCG